MRHHNSSRKIFVTVGGLAVFVIGAVLGSFLVLGSNTSEGKSFLIKNTLNAPENEGATLHTTKAAPRVENYTEKFSEVAMRAVGASRISSEEKAAEMLAEKDLAGIIAARKAELHDPLPDFAPRVAPAMSGTEYLQKFSPRFRIVREIFFEVFNQDVLQLSEEEVAAHYQQDAEVLQEVITQLQNMQVAGTYSNLHAATVDLAAALHIVVSDFAHASEDPLTILLTPVSGEVLAQKMKTVSTLLP